MCRGRRGVPKRGGGQAGGGHQKTMTKTCAKVDYNPMSNALDSSSDATRSDDDVLPPGMIALAIACTSLQRQSKKESRAAGNRALCFIALASNQFHKV